ncbi:MAG: cytochrome c biogenesis protein CcdA [Anaerolineaceae bacterium]|nr:cytochrome c biogenesis protein CcdA [Anaerolineaceae bacterium]
MNVTLELAFLAGLASFLSPCVFSLVPAYIGYLSGRSIAGTKGVETPNRWRTFGHGLAFVFGFSVVFVLLGVAVSFLGSLIYESRTWIARIGGVVIVIFGLHMSGLVRIPFLDYELRPQSGFDRSWGYLSSMLMGVFFSAGWSPCIGPVLGLILTMALDVGSIGRGTQLLTAYSAGLAIPFLLAAYGIDSLTNIFRRNPKLIHAIEVSMGGVMVIVGVMLFFGVFELLSHFGLFVNFGI